MYENAAQLDWKSRKYVGYLHLIITEAFTQMMRVASKFYTVDIPSCSIYYSESLQELEVSVRYRDRCISEQQPEDCSLQPFLVGYNTRWKPSPSVTLSCSQAIYIADVSKNLKKGIMLNC
ncbi:hypothetical protein RvY_04635 [Ramazzottius varieornatus]|uniref:Uncharacterized protein n=1 Tax=Ramazzottius varieornatus TaxID=947166 RepID=A0A1D1UXZ4_RAMVA|nr:hypothetical protein RvY_04635 [Ramazzottius varieornatus]